MAKAIPRYQEIARELRRQIDSGSYPTGYSLPSEAQLAERFGVAPGTVRQALGVLVDEGMLSARRGARKVVMRSSVSSRGFNEFRSFAQWAYGQGRTPGGLVVEQRWREPSENDVEALRLAEGDEVLQVLRVRTLDGEPILLERTRYTPQVGRKVAELRPDSPSVTNQLRELFGIEFAAADHVFSAAAADDVDARHLRLAEGDPILRHLRLSRDRWGTPLERSEDHYVSGAVSLAVSNAQGNNSLGWISAPGR